MKDLGGYLSLGSHLTAETLRPEAVTERGCVRSQSRKQISCLGEGGWPCGHLIMTSFPQENLVFSAPVF